MIIEVKVDRTLRTGSVVSINYEFYDTFQKDWMKNNGVGVSIYSVGYRLESIKQNKTPIRNIVIKVPWGKKKKIEENLVKKGYEIR